MNGFGNDETVQYFIRNGEQVDLTFYAIDDILVGREYDRMALIS